MPRKVFDTDFGRIAILICWDMTFPEVWHAAASQGAELVLWPSAGHGGRPLEGYAQIHNIYIASNGGGQFYDRLGSQQTPAIAFNHTLQHPPAAPAAAAAGDTLHAGHDHDRSIPIAVATLDLDSTVVFYGGPAQKRTKYDSFVSGAGANAGIVEAVKDEVSMWSVLKATRAGAAGSVRAALRAAAIETRREESTRNRIQNNVLRAKGKMPAV